jgi:glutamine amidotransferase
VKPAVTVVDYGLGNLFSVARALETCGAQVEITDSPAGIERAERLVLPGVGAFADGMNGLEQRALVAPLQQYGADQRPLLGICLGMQLLMSLSEEFGSHRGLGLIQGSVLPIPAARDDTMRRKVPHVGWSEIVRPGSLASWQGSILQGLRSGIAMYFVHSFTAWPDDPSARLADCDYEGALVSAALRSGSVSGCQFHPERSGEHGLTVLRNFLGPSSAD